MKTTKPNIKNLLKGYYYVNSHITEKNYSLPDKIDLTGVKVIRMGKSFSSQEALDKMKAEGCRPATIWELAAFKQENEAELKGKSEWYLAFGSSDFVADGYRRVPCVDAHSGGDFRFSLGDFEFDWRDNACLVCFCDSSLAPQTLSKSEDSDTLTLPNFISELKALIKKYE